MSEEEADRKYRSIWSLLRSGDGWVQKNSNHDGRFFLTMMATKEKKSEILNILR